MWWKGGDQGNPKTSTDSELFDYLIRKGGWGRRDPRLSLTEPQPQYGARGIYETNKHNQRYYFFAKRIHDLLSTTMSLEQRIACNPTPESSFHTPLYFPHGPGWKFQPEW